jgi:hypothetical protein
MTAFMLQGRAMNYRQQRKLIIQVQPSTQQLLLIWVTLHVSTFNVSSSGVSSYVLLHSWIAM